MHEALPLVSGGAEAQGVDIVSPVRFRYHVRRAASCLRTLLKQFDLELLDLCQALPEEPAVYCGILRPPQLCSRDELHCPRYLLRVPDRNDAPADCFQARHTIRSLAGRRSLSGSRAKTTAGGCRSARPGRRASGANLLALMWSQSVAMWGALLLIPLTRSDEVVAREGAVRNLPTIWIAGRDF